MVHRAHPAQRALDALGVVALDVLADSGDEHLDRDPAPVPPVEHLVFHPAEEAFHRRVVGAAAPSDMERVMPASS